jgi:hypothetical protein
MKLYVLTQDDGLTTCYHDNGGLVVVARDKDHANEVIRESHSKGGYNRGEALRTPNDGEWAQAVVYELVGDPKPAVFIHPDAGCC